MEQSLLASSFLYMKNIMYDEGNISKTMYEEDIYKKYVNKMYEEQKVYRTKCIKYNIYEVNVQIV